MELLWKAVPGLVLLLLASAAASQIPPRVQVRSVGDTWITVLITQPQSDRNRDDVEEYQVAFGSGHSDIVVRQVRNKEHDGYHGTEVTLGELRPGTKYLIQVKAVYADNSKSPESVLRVKTSSLYEYDDHTMNYRERGMMSAGAPLTFHAVKYVLIGLNVILFLVMAS